MSIGVALVSFLLIFKTFRTIFLAYSTVFLLLALNSHLPVSLGFIFVKIKKNSQIVVLSWLLTFSVFLWQ